MKKVARLIFPILAIIGLFIALLDYVKEKQVVSLNQRMTEVEKTLRTDVPHDDLIREYEQDNKTLKKGTFALSPDRAKAAYFQHKLTNDIKEIGDRDYMSLVIEQRGRIETVFQSDVRLSHFEWLNDKEIAVYRGCGTECMLVYIVDTDSKKYREFLLGVGYTWSPNKQYVLAYHYSYQYGISVAEKGGEYGRTVFQIRRVHPQDGSGLASQTKAAWSKNSAKLALIIRKENKERLELLVFNVKKNFKLLLQQDVVGDRLIGLGWDDQRTLFYTIGEETKKVTI